MQAFHNDPAIKARYLDRIGGDLAKGRFGLFTNWTIEFWSPVHLTLNDIAGDFTWYPDALGLPEWLAVIEDDLFPMMPQDRALTWPRDLLAAVPVGLSEERLNHVVRAPFVRRLLSDSLDTFVRRASPEVERVIQAAIDFWDRDDLFSYRWSREAMALKVDASGAAPPEPWTPAYAAARLAEAVLSFEGTSAADQMTDAIEQLDPGRADAYAAQVLSDLKSLARPDDANWMLAAVRAASSTDSSPHPHP